MRGLGSVERVMSQITVSGAALKLNPRKPHGFKGPLHYRVEVFASDDDKNMQGFASFGILHVR
jgi:hypothetical protein